MEKSQNGNCPLCGRDLESSQSKNLHHLIPHSKKGKETVLLHKICHRKIHSVFTNKELARYYHTIKRILENHEMRKFVEWVSNKDIDFYDTSRDTKRKKRKR